MSENQIQELCDEKTGAQYGYVSKDTFSVLPIKNICHIGEGSTCDVTLVEHRDTPQVLMAAKVFCFNDQKKAEAKRRTFLQEVGALQELEHENIVKCIRAVICPTYATILMDFYPEGPLYEHLDTLEDENVHLYFSQIASALRYMHSRQIVHRDVKPDNILIKNSTAYLTDFGSSQKLTNGSSAVTGAFGTPVFMAPEARSASWTTEYDGYKADSFSMGVVLWCMMMKDEPEEDTELGQTLDLETFDPILSDCAHRLLIEDPAERWDITLLLDHLG